MTTPLPLGGLHHVSALTAHAAQGHAFYTRVLGLRLVKKTVNQDDPRMYHLFYGDGAGTPGSEITFFDFPRAAREHRGVGSISRTTFRVTGRDALTFWAGRLTAEGVSHGGLTRRDGRLHLDFEDPNGTRLSLFDDGGEGPRGVPNPRTDVPAAWQLQGLGHSGFTVADLAPTRAFLERGLGLSEVRSYPTGRFTTHVFQSGAGGPHAELHVTERDDLPRHRPGAGGVHHVALRVADVAQLRAWLAQLTRAGHANSGLVDRHYFQSVYLQDLNGLVIELATDGPGFTSDEAPEHLGERLALPPFLEARRADIEAHLRPLSISGARP